MNKWHSIPIKISYSDFTAICRICFARNNLRDMQEVEYLIDVLQSLTNTKASLDDGLPQNICLNCIKKLEDISDFMDLSKYNDSLLRHVHSTKKEVSADTVTWDTNDDDKDDENNGKSTMRAELIIINSGSINQTSDNPTNSASGNCPQDPGKTNTQSGKRSEKKSSGKTYGLTKRKTEKKDDYGKTRREQNREAAARSRRRRLDLMLTLSQEVEILESENQSLKDQKEKLETEINDLIIQLARFKCKKKHTKVRLEKGTS